MKLSALTVSNYRAFQSAHIELPPDGIALVVGPNNAGKSAILSALDIVAGTDAGARVAREGGPDDVLIQATFALTDDERSQLLAVAREVGRYMRVPTEERWPAPWFDEWRLSFAQASETEVHASAVEVRTAEDPPDDFRPIARLTRHADGNFLYEHTSLGNLLGTAPDAANWNLHSQIGGLVSLPRGVRGLEVLTRLLNDWRRGYYHFKALRSGAPRTAPAHGAPTLEADGSNLPQALLYLSSNLEPAWQEIVATMQQLVPDVGHLASPVSGSHVETVFVDPFTNTRRNIKDLGTGVEQLLLTVYVGVRTELTRFVAIEEPETKSPSRCPADPHEVSARMGEGPRFLARHALHRLPRRGVRTGRRSTWWIAGRVSPLSVLRLVTFGTSSRRLA